MIYIGFGLVVLYLFIKDGMRRDHENRVNRLGTQENEDAFAKRSLAPYAGIERD